MKMSKRRIITFSGRMRSGKGVLSRMMQQQFGAETFSMASHLKELCIKILDIESPTLAPWNIAQMNAWKNTNDVLNNGGILLSENSLKTIADTTGFDIECVKEKGKNIRFHTVRELLQTVGTNIIRQLNPDWHIMKTIEDIEKLPENVIVCIDDIRFKNELEVFRAYGADTFYIIRDNAENVSNHDSEIGLSLLDFPDNRIILNIGCEKYLCNTFADSIRNNFTLQTNFPILLSEFPCYKSLNRSFGIIKTPMVEELIRENKNNEAFSNLFLKDGFILHDKNSNFSIQEVIAEMGVLKENLIDYYNFYAIDNPVAYENLKRWL